MPPTRAKWFRGARRRWRVGVATVGATLMSAALLTGFTAQPQDSAEPVDLEECPWMDTSLSADERARLLLDASSLEQKMRWLVEPAANNPDETEISVFGQTAVYPAQVPCTPVIQYTDSPVAVTSGSPTGITAFPAQIALAATWDEALSWDKGKAHGFEAFYKHRNVLLGPGLASGRVPYLGRNSEYLGEDPVLGGVMAGAMVRGLQEGNPDAPVQSVPKHYTANEQELDRGDSSSNIDQRTLREIYTLPYEIAIKEGEPGGIMCSFPQINGEWACENENLLRQILKDEIGFDGWVVTDFFGFEDAAAGLNGGLDQELVGPRLWNPETLHALLDAGEITEEMIDEAAFRIVSSHIRTGMFDNPLPDEPLDDVSTPQNQDVAQRVAEEGSVLLKNEGILPLDESVDEVAVIGPTASNEPTDGVSAVSVCGPSRPDAHCEPVAPLDGITDRAAEDGGSVVFDDGSDPAAAAATAADADVAIVFGYYTQGEGDDLESLSLANGGDELVEAVASANSDTVVVLQTGGPVLMPWLDDVDGVLETWYPGQEMGTAIARLLWGDMNPSGKLPQTFPASEADLPTAGSEAQYPGIVDENGIRQVDYSEGLEVGYRWYDSQGIEPLFEFGHGLSYTTFEYSKLRVTPRKTDGTKEIRVKFRVTNTGDRAGREIAQVYLDLPADAGEPPKRLAGWAGVELEPGEHRNVTVRLDAEDLENRHLLQYWDESTGEWSTPDGTYTAHVGASSRDLPLAETFEIR